MWESQQSGAFEKVAITNGSTLQEWFRVKVYDKDKAKGVLSNNLTKNEKFFGRVNITSDGSLMMTNSTVQDSGNYKCSYRGITGPVQESLIHLRVKPFKGKTNVSVVVRVWQVDGGGAMLINPTGIAINPSVSQLTNQ